jgi:hypothetical protein
MSGQNPVVVCGIDDSPGARAALEEALRLAARRGARVRALLVYEPPEAWSAWSYGSGAAVPSVAAWQEYLNPAPEPGTGGAGGGPGRVVTAPTAASRPSDGATRRSMSATRG